VVAVALSTSPVSASAQSKIPIRQLAPIEATTTETFVQPQLKAWQWDDGHIVVASGTRAGRALLYDQNLSLVRVLADSSLTPMSPSFSAFVAVQYSHDTTAVADAANSAMLLLDRDGKQVRIMALPHATDMTNIKTGQFPLFVDKGRLVYLTAYFRPPAAPADAPTAPTTAAAPAAVLVYDSSAIVRANFDTRVVDTLGAKRQALSQRMTTTTDADGKTVRTAIMIPNTGTDVWSMLADGSVAIVRHQDYHIDWIYPDGSRASTPKMPFDWRRLTDIEKQRLLDSMRLSATRSDSMANEREKARRPGQPGGPPVPIRVYAALGEIPGYYQPIKGADVISPDADNRLWVLPTTSKEAQGGLLYDVINTKGEIVERVQLPPNAALAGFGKNGVVFLRMVRSDRTNAIARTHIIR
jgi:hypothetical protein